MKTSNKSDRNKKVYNCKMCGRSIEPLKFAMEDYAYKRNTKDSKIMYYCSYHCMRASLLEDEAKKRAKKLSRHKTSAIV